MAFKETLGPAVVRAGILTGASAAVSFVAGEYQAAAGLLVGFGITSLNLWLLSRALLRFLNRKPNDPHGRITLMQYFLRFTVFTVTMAMLAKWSAAALLGGFGGVLSIKAMLYLEGIRPRTHHKEDGKRP